MSEKVDRIELENFANSNIGFFGIDLTRISTLFIAQIYHLYQNRILNTHQIMDEVKSLEGLRNSSSTKNVDSFKYLPLKGLMKKHFTNPRFIAKNISNHWNLENGGNKKLDRKMNDLFKQTSSDCVDERFANELSHLIVDEAFKDRALNNKLTGEWIIFKVFEGKNYYLTLASHTEKDDEIFKRVEIAFREDFPFLEP